MILSRIFPAAAAVQLAHSSMKEEDNFMKKNKSGLKQAKKSSRKLVKRLMKEVGAPGVVVAVSVDGATVWSKGFGYADVENGLRCTPNSVMRVASISKSFTALAMAKLWEEGKLNLDKPIQEYLPEFPQKYFEGSKADITLRGLLSHTSGIRHYAKSLEKKDEDEFAMKEYYIMNSYKTVTDSLALFKDDPLVKKPGEYLYTTHGWTLISAVLEKVSGKDFLLLMADLFRRMGMSNTVPDFHHTLVYGRARYYRRSGYGKLENAPYVDNSYKWAGGGFLSTVGDLLKFGNVMMYSYQHDNKNDDKQVMGLLRSDTVRKMWSEVSTPNRGSLENWRYGLGWSVFTEMERCGFCPDVQFEVSHSGGAVGASSVLFLIPEPPSSRAPTTFNDDDGKPQVRGIAVAIICNLQSVGLTGLARSIAKEFQKQLSYV